MAGATVDPADVITDFQDGTDLAAFDFRFPLA